MKKMYAVLWLLLCQQLLFAQGDMAMNVLSNPHLAQENLSENTLSGILGQIEKKFKVFFNFDPDLISNKDIDGKVIISDDLNETLERVLKPLGLEYQKLGDSYYAIYPVKERAVKEKMQPLENLPVKESGENDVGDNGSRGLVSPKIFHRTDLSKLLKQESTITGRVTDSEGEALIGVNVLVKGTNKGTSTDFEGNFTLEDVNENAVLVVSYIGYQTQEIPVNGEKEITITLLEDLQTLDEVVVVGYGQSSKKKLSTSVSTLDQKKLNDVPITNIANAFTGNVSGVLVEENSGAPGAAPVIRVRGYGSINAGSEPLYVIDGMMVSSREFSLLNPKSVESVNVLKDAAAGAIYGSRAGNGVVIVTTKSGQGEAKFSYSSSIGFQQAEKKIDVLSGPEYIQYSEDAYAASGNDAPVFSANVANTNWQNEIFRTGVYQNHQIAVNGSMDKINYNVSFNYLGDEGILITTFENNYSSNGNFNIKLNDRLSLGLTYNASFTKSRVNDKLGGPGHGSGGIMEDAIVQYPVIPVYMPNGDYGQVNSENWGTPVVYGGYGNPVAGLQEVFDRRSGFSGIGRTFLNYELTRGLKINLSMDGMVNSRFRDFHESPYLGANGHSNEANFSNPRYDQISAEQSNSSNYNYTFEGFFDYSNTFSNDHSIQVIGGFSNQYRGFRSTSAWATENDRGANANDPIPRFSNYLRPNIYGANDVRGGGDFSEETFTSLFTRLNYDIADKYLFMASIRRDGSSKFAPNFRYGIFPAVSAAWRISEEPFMTSQDLFDELKLRLSYGISGNDQIGNYEWQGTVSYGGQYVYGPSDLSEGVAITAYPASIENSNLRWETNKQFNVGIDLGILKQRILLTSDFYIKTTEDLILNRPLPAENGISSNIFDNIGNMKNTGVEVTLTTINILNEQFQWSTKWIFNKVWNTATDLFTESGRISLGSGTYDMVWIREGFEMFEIWGYKSIGVFETQSQLDQYPRPRDSNIGDPIYEEVVEDQILNSDDYQLLGHALPNFTFGMSNSLNFKNWDLNITVDGSQGASKYVPAFRNQSWVSPIEGNISKLIYEQSGEKFGAANLNYSGNRLERSSYHVFDASFVRIKNLTLGYDFPTKLYNFSFIHGLRLSLGVQNLFTFTEYPWYNPQSNYYSGGAGSAQFGVDYGSYPLARKYVLGINLTF